jgi:hypothetical protein
MFGAFTGVAVDAGPDGTFAVVPHTVRIAIRWCLLAGIQNRALADARSALGKRYDPKHSERVSEWYLCALALSEPIQRHLHATRRSMKDDVYPEDIKAIPIKLITPKQQQPFIELARERHRLWAEIIALEERDFGKGGEVPVWEVVRAFHQANPKVKFWRLVHAATSDVFKIDRDYWKVPLSGLRNDGDVFYLKREVAGRLGPAIKSDRGAVASILARLLSALPATYSERENLDEIPATTAGLVALGTFFEEQAREVPRRYERILAIDAEIDGRTWALYRPRKAVVTDAADEG